MEIRVLTVYGVPRCLPEASLRNNVLLTWLYERATSSRIPTLIGGDFNTNPMWLPAWRHFSALGWSELGHFTKETRDVELPATCKEATRFDTFLVPPLLQ